MDPSACLPSAAPSAPARPLLRRLLNEMAIGAPLYLGLGVFFSLAFGDPLGRTLVFSLCIGPICQGLIRVGQFAMARNLIRRGRTGPGLLHHHWPGWAWMGPWILVSVVIGYVLGANLAAMLLGLPGRGLPGNARTLFVVVTVCALAVAALVYFLASRAHVAMVEAEAQAAQRAAAETQLKLLQSQLEPHMLFNTLANLRVLIGADPARAQAMLDRLIAFLRSTLAASRSDSHPLRDEFARIADYLALMQVRMGERLAVELALPEALAGLPVPPLLLQPLVENAVKHGLEPQVAGGRLWVSARRETGTGGGGDMLVLTVRDTGVGLDAAAAGSAAGGGSRFGLQQVRDRLAALYGDTATLALAEAPAPESGCQAVLRLPLPASHDGGAGP